MLLHYEVQRKPSSLHWHCVLRRHCGLRKLEKIFKISLDKKEIGDSFNISIGKNNMGCIRDALTRVVSELSKHVDVKYQFIINNVQNQNL